MSELDKMLDAPAETALPPLVRYCKNRKEAGDKIEVELYRPDADGLSRANLDQLCRIQLPWRRFFFSFATLRTRPEYVHL